MCVCCVAVFVSEVDAAAFTIKTIDDPRTLNKTLYLRPCGNVCSMNDLVEMWEGKIEKKTYFLLCPAFPMCKVAKQRNVSSIWIL